MVNKVRAGYNTTASFTQRLRASGKMPNATHDAQPIWREGIAAYWLEAWAIAPELKSQGPPNSSNVSTKPNEVAPL